MTKKELRALYLKKRLSLSQPELAELNQKLCNNFFKHIDLSKVKVFHTFLPLAQKNEPNTWLIINEVKKRFSEIRISIPKINMEGILENYYFESAAQLETSAWGIPEPKYGQLTPPAEIDFVVIPLLAYDKHGHRVGYGKGHYDRFLKTCRKDCQKIGLSLFLAEEKIDDVFEGDELLHQVITPEKEYHF